MRGRNLTGVAVATLGVILATGRDWRNRHIDHADLEFVTNENAKPLTGASRKNVREALEAIANVLNYVERHYLGSQALPYNHISPHGGASRLLEILKGAMDQVDVEAEG